MSITTMHDGRVVLHQADCRDVLRGLADNSIDSVVTDPPYALVSIQKRFANSPRSEATENQENPYGRTGRGFMGKAWDNGETAFSEEFWAEVLRVLKPGGHVVPACAVDAPHRRDRLWFVAHAEQPGQRGHSRDARGEAGQGGGEAWPQDGNAVGRPCDARGSGNHDSSLVGDTEGFGRQGEYLPSGTGLQAHRASEAGRRNSTAWSGAEFIVGADGKARRIEPGIRLLAHGVPARVGRLRAYGNAIVPQVAAEVIAAFMETHSPSARSAPSFDPLLGSGGLPLEQGE